jgi:hypothetical protein
MLKAKEDLPFSISHFIGEFNFQVQQLGWLSLPRSEMFIERATAERFSSLQRSENQSVSPRTWETLRSAGAPIIGLRALSINISPRWGEEIDVLLHFEPEFANGKSCFHCL